MMNLDDFRPSEAELEATDGMPEQVAIGFIRASRRAMGGRRRYDRSYTPAGDLLHRIFGGEPK
jgi:hypothetical protein